METVVKNIPFEPESIAFSNSGIDARTYNNLRVAVGWAPYQETAIVEGLNGTPFSVVALNGDTAIGMARVVGDGKLVFYIQDVIVLPEYQRLGIGTKLMNLVMEFIDSRSVDHSVIGLLSAVGKEAFYERFGFIKRPNETVGAGMNIWVKK